MTHDELLAHLRGLPHTDVDASRDYANSVSSKVIRCRYDGRRAVAVGADSGTKIQITALLDLLDLHLQSPADSPDGVALLLGGVGPGTEALDALGSLLSQVQGRADVHVHVANDEGRLEQVSTRPFDASDERQYAGWKDLLLRVAARPPDIVHEVLAHAGRPELRAYPMLSSSGGWSLRLEGLEVGRFSGGHGTLDVGKPGRRGVSKQREAWQRASGAASTIEVTSSSTQAAAQVLAAFADEWLSVPPQGSRGEQDEHALESRVLRGAVDVVIPGGERLEVLAGHPGVNWGSQFPTKWGRLPSRARYLDALLHSGRTPWAVEIKVLGGAGAGQYYRHAVAQAVLYRHFIRGATPLKPWFDRYHLDQGRCRAAVLVPEIPPAQASWAHRLRSLAGLFEVEVVEVDPAHAVIH